MTSPDKRRCVCQRLRLMELREVVQVTTKLLMQRCAALALASGWLFVGAAVAQPVRTHMPATQHQQRVLRNTRDNHSRKIPATVHQKRVLRNLHPHPSATPIR